MIIQKRKRQLTVRLTDEEYKVLKSKSEIAGMKMEPFVRGLVSNYEIKALPPNSYNRLCKQLSAIGNNLNQIAHVVNLTGKASATQLDEAKSLLEKMWDYVEDSL